MKRKFINRASLSVILSLILLGSVQAASIEIGKKSLSNGIDIKAVYLQSVQMDMSGMMMSMPMMQDVGASCNEHTFMAMNKMPEMGSEMSGMSVSQKMPEMKISGPQIGMSENMPNAMDMMNQIHLSAYILANEKNIHAFTKGEYIPYLKACYVVKKHNSDYINEGHLMAMISSDGPHYGTNAKLSGPGKYSITFFISQPYGFHRHTDDETGIPDWWKPFSVQWDFTFVGTGKKGSY